MSQSVTPFQPNQSRYLAPAQCREAAIYTHPDDVASDPMLTTPQKRALLASWVSDARTVESAPALRRLDSGAVVEVDTILRALSLLDGLATDHREDRNRPPLTHRRRSLISRWLSRIGPPNGANDNDDDPPPAPAGFAVPLNLNFVAAHGARPGAHPGLACAGG
jgi:hypothetical protein